MSMHNFVCLAQILHLIDHGTLVPRGIRLKSSERLSTVLFCKMWIWGLQDVDLGSATDAVRSTAAGDLSGGAAPCRSSIC